jgi:A/G-specific adenine glycosylase
MDRKRRTTVRKKLLAWYAVEARELPWRRTTDPYAILVSEIMLQQTRVDTVLSYYERFLRQFPTVAALAAAPIDDVLKAWEGLGYYRRAHNLHRAARAVMELHGGSIPRSATLLKALPGIGPYTAAAVASIAFHQDEAVLDGNVIRVVSRLFAIPGNPATAVTRNALQAASDRLLAPGDACRFNQALMDLGARVCLSRRPRCAECPVAAECNAHHAGEETRYPERPKRRPIPHRNIVAGIIWENTSRSQGARILIAKRHADDMLGGLWEFPGGHVESGESLEEALMRELREELDIDVADIVPFLTVEHAYTHFRMSLHCFHCRYAGGTPAAVDVADWTWARVEDLASYAFPVADQRILEALTRRR